MGTTKTKRSVGPVLFTREEQTTEHPGWPAWQITVNRADPGDTNVVLSTARKGPGSTVLTPANARRLAEALVRAAAAVEGTLECSYCRDRMGLDNVGEDDSLHRPANQCKGCGAPLDHHEFRID